jgi:hypothetical protein
MHHLSYHVTIPSASKPQFIAGLNSVQRQRSVGVMEIQATAFTAHHEISKIVLC